MIYVTMHRDRNENNIGYLILRSKHGVTPQTNMKYNNQVMITFTPVPTILI